MRELERKALQERFVAALQHLNKVPEKLAWYHAERTSEEQMLMQIQYYDNWKKEHPNADKA
jgi:hypothetical protein